jgi:predicted dehydrogenase
VTTEKLRVGLIGCGHIALLHARAIAADPRLEPWAYADTRVDAARSFLRDHGGQYASNDGFEVIADDDVDIVVIATHHDSHAPLSIAAARAGRHILLEKPLATSVHQAESIAAEVEKAAVCCQVNYKFRLERSVIQARNAIRDPRLVVIQLAMPRIGPQSDDHWVFDPIRGGGLVAATGTHLLDLALWLSRSEPVAVSGVAAAVGARTDGLPDITVGSVEYASGAVASVVLADVGENPVLSKWSCQIYDGSQCVVLSDRLLTVSFSDGLSPAEDPTGDPPASMLAALADSILEGTPPVAGVDDGVRAVRLATALAESARLRRRVTLDEIP